MYDSSIPLTAQASPPEELSFPQRIKPGEESSLSTLLSTLHRDPHVRGAEFELIAKWYLENEPKYSGLIEQVWRWDDWPGRDGRDIGIDLVVKTRSGELWAVQSKCYAESQDIAKSEIDSFLSASNSESFSYRLLIATTDRIGSNAARTIRAQEKPVGTVLLSNLEASEVPWPLSVKSLHLHPVRERPTPLPHQVSAVGKCVKGFEFSDRGQLIHACGTGKTLTSLWVHEALDSQATLVTAPSIGLISQTINAWSRAAKEPFDYIVVCSDKTVTKGVEQDSPSSLGVPVTTDALKIKEFLEAPHDRPVVVFSTYQSIPVLSLAQRATAHSFKLLVADEAHVCTGLEGGLFTQVLQNEVIRAEKRLFATATPRIFSEPIKEAVEEEGLTVCSMDDSEVFGSVFSSLSYRQALEAKLVSDYKVVVVGVTDNEVADAIKRGAFVREDQHYQTDARSLGIRIALLKALKEYDLSKVITFHSTVSGARALVADRETGTLRSALPFMSPEDRPDGEFWTGHISGATPAAERVSKLRALKNLPPHTRGVVSNCACLGTGTDVPALDGIAIIDPRSSATEIVQIVGRVTRKSADKEAGVILIPVFIESDKTAEDLLSGSEFKKVWQVIRALRSHDEVLSEELDELRKGIKSRPGSTLKFPSGLHFDLPTALPEGFGDAITLKVVNACTRKPDLTVEKILGWADAHFAREGKWPTTNSGVVHEQPDETWSAIDAALREGLRDLAGGSSLAKLLAQHRGVRNHKDLPKLSEKEILKWADEYYAKEGRWPNQKSEVVHGHPDENWTAIDSALRIGVRDLPGGSSLAKLLSEHRGVRNQTDLPKITADEILTWVDEHFAKEGSWPTKQSGIVHGHPNERWSAIDSALRAGSRALPGGSSLAILLAEHRGVRNQRDLPKLSEEEILTWADEHFAKEGKWPNKNSEVVHGHPDESWGAIDAALREGHRDLAGGSSLAKLLSEHRGVRNQKSLPTLTVEEILKWADEHYAKLGKWPTAASGLVHGHPGESWNAIVQSLREGGRGLTGGSSLAKLLAEHRGVRNRKDLPQLSEEEILKWADVYYAKEGRWPSAASGVLHGHPGESWGGINAALRDGLRGLPGGSSLAELLSKWRKA